MGKCPVCGSNAAVLLITVECSNTTCQNHPKKPTTMNPKLQQALNDPNRQNHPTSQSELSRIINTPLSHGLTDRELEEFNRLNLKADIYTAKTPDGKPKFRLYESQARSVLWYDRYKGVFAPISCGGGKTGTSLMIAERAWRRGMRKIMLLIPPEIYTQLTQRQNDRESDIASWRKTVELTIPFTGMGNLPGPGARARKAEQRKFGCFIVPHSLMSTQDSSELLEKINPGLIIIDEAHRFKNKNAAKTKRLLTYVRKHKPHLIILSGSITDRTIKDYFHFLEPTLHERSPLPLNYLDMLNWSQVLDTGSEPTEELKKGLTPLVSWGRRHFATEKYEAELDAEGNSLKGKAIIEDLKFDVSGIRKAYRLRLAHTPGVVSTADSGVGTTLVIRNIVVPRPNDESGKKLEEIEAGVEAMKTPNGDPISHAMQKFKWRYELSAGFYNKLYWPSPETVSKRKNITIAKAKEILTESLQAHNAHTRYSQELRKWFGNGKHRPGLDTPFLVGQSMMKNKSQFVGPELYELFVDWKQREKDLGDDLIERDSEPVRICDYKIKAAVQWAKELRSKKETKTAGLIIWYYHQEIGVWATEEAVKIFGKNGVVHCPAGDEYNKVILDKARNGNKVIVASWKAHGTGKNLQHFQHQWFIQFPRNCGEAEQLLARTHRPGQLADELVMHLCNSHVFDHQNFSACIRDATYVQQSMGSRQKLLMARYEPIPPMFPRDSFKEAGISDVAELDQEGEDYLKEKFGDGKGGKLEDIERDKDDEVAKGEE